MEMEVWLAVFGEKYGEVLKKVTSAEIKYLLVVGS